MNVTEAANPILRLAATSQKATTPFETLGEYYAIFDMYPLLKQA